MCRVYESHLQCNDTLQGGHGNPKKLANRKNIMIDRDEFGMYMEITIKDGTVPEKDTRGDSSWGLVVFGWGLFRLC